MPRYDFQCPACKTITEYNVSYRVERMPCYACSPDPTNIQEMAARLLCAPACIHIH